MTEIGPIKCPNCGEDEYSIFGKLYIKEYGKCISCSTEVEIMNNSDKIAVLIYRQDYADSLKRKEI